MKPLRVGLVGCGFVSINHLDGYATMPDRVRVVAAVDPDDHVRETRMNSYGISRGFSSLERMLQEVELDAVDIASPREHHADACLLAAQHGLPILCQKPLAPTFNEAAALVESLPSATRLMVHENWRFRPHYRVIRQWIADGDIGPLRQVMMRVLTSGLLADDQGALPALARQPMMSGLSRMLLMEVMIHHVDVLRFLLGPLDLLAADLDRDCEALCGEDRATLMLRVRSGGAVTMVGDFMAHGYPPSLSDRLEIFGRDGAIQLQDDQLTLLRNGEVAQSRSIDLAADYKSSYAGAIAHFVECLETGAPFETAPEDNLQTLALIEKAYATGCHVPDA